MTRFPMPDYTTEELNRQYENTSSPEAVKALKELRSRSARCRERFAFRTVSYGSEGLQTADCFLPERQPAPAILFVHGGQWRLNTTVETSFWAEATLERGYALIAINYPKMPEARIADQADCVVAAYGHVVAHAASLGVDPARLILAGHSSGAHLAALAAARGIGREASRPTGLMLLSGMYDLEPVRRSNRNVALELTEVEARAASPFWQMPPTLPPTLVAVGAQETDEFIRQAHVLHEALGERGDHRFALLADHSHFTAPLALYQYNRLLWPWINTICR